MALTTLWFILIAVLWIGYFVLEGFDFGVGILLPFLGRDDADRRAMIGTIGPVWDGNEVWLLTAGGATFAAFPLWYASLFSGFYLALLLILVALIVRGVSFEFRGKLETARWRKGWDQAIFWGSALPALLWGVAFANIVRGVPMNAAHVVTGNLLTLLNPYGLLGGLATLTLFALHGAIFLSLRTTGDLRAAGPEGGGAHRGRHRAGGRRVPGGQPGGARPAGHRPDRRGGRGGPAGRGGGHHPGPGGLGLRGHRPDPAARGGDAVRRPVAGRAAVHHGRGVQPYRSQRVISALHADGHDLGCPALHPGGAGLPGLDLLGVPAPGRRNPGTAAAAAQAPARGAVYARTGEALAQRPHETGRPPAAPLRGARPAATWS